MARANCQCCKKQLDTKEALKVVVNGKNKYWCNDHCYKITEEEQARQAKINAEYDEIFELTKQIFGYEFAGYSLLRRELSVWEKLATRQKIIVFLKENKDWLSDVMNKEFASDFNRVRYYSTIVAGKLHDFKPKKIEVEKPKVSETSFELFAPTTVKQPKLEEQVLYDVEDDLI